MFGSNVEIIIDFGKSYLWPWCSEATGCAVSCLMVWEAAPSSGKHEADKLQPQGVLFYRFMAFHWQLQSFRLTEPPDPPGQFYHLRQQPQRLTGSMRQICSQVCWGETTAVQVYKMWNSKFFLFIFCLLRLTRWDVFNQSKRHNQLLLSKSWSCSVLSLSFLLLQNKYLSQVRSVLRKVLPTQLWSVCFSFK